MGSLLQIFIGVVAGLALLWLILLAVLWRTRPADSTTQDALRLVPDTIRLIKRLAVDPTPPRGLRLRLGLGLGLGYLLLPIDLVPDFLPVIGYADDAIVVGSSYGASSDLPEKKRSQPTGRVHLRASKHCPASLGSGRPPRKPI